MRKLWTVLRCIYCLVTGILGIIGLAGMRDDRKVWVEEWIPMLDFLDIFPVWLALFISGIAVVTYPQWIPVIQRWKKRDNNVDSGDRSLLKARLLLSEAATGIVDAQPNRDVDDRRASLLFGSYYGVILLFLEMAFVVNHADDMRHYVQSRRRDAEIMASFLKTLRERITSDELDPGFVLPMTFDEFVNHHDNWPRNPNLG